MKTLGTIVLALVLAGCASHRVPTVCAPLKVKTYHDGKKALISCDGRVVVRYSDDHN